jgi:signal transduction histidine kinase/ABC-type sugar transport system substrate-binding protein
MTPYWKAVPCLRLFLLTAFLLAAALHGVCGGGALAAAGTAAVAVEGGATPSPEKRPEGAELHFVFFYPHQDRFWTDCVSYAKATATALGARLEAVNFNFNRESMLRELEAVLKRGVDGIIFQPSGTDAEAVFALAERYGVPTILINTDLEDIDYFPRTKYRQWIAKIIPADRQAGALLMERLLDVARQAGVGELHILAVGGTPGQGAAELRRKGMEQCLKYQGDVKSLAVDHGDWLPERAAAIFREQYRKNPKINVVWVANDYMALGIRDEMDRMGIAHPPVIGGIDWSRDAVAAVGTGRMQATIGGHFMEGALAVALLYDYVRGKDFAAEGIAFGTGMTALTADTFGPLKQFQALVPSELRLEKLSKVANPEMKYYSFEVLNIIRAVLPPPSAVGTFRLSETDRQWLAEQAGRFVVGLERDYPPFSFVDEGGVHRGLAVDYLKQLESRLGVGFGRSEPAPLGKLLAEAKEKRIHVLMAVKSNPERRQYLHFTKPFIDVPVVLLTAGAAGSRLEDFRGAGIATAKGYGVTDYLTREHPDVRQVLFDNDYEAMMGVVLGKAGAAVVDIATATYLLRQHGLSSLKIVGMIGFSYDLSFASTDERLAKILDATLASIPADARKQIHDAWFTLPGAPKFLDTLTSGERAWLAGHPVLRTAYDGNRVPFEYLGRNGERLGISGEYLDRLERMLGVRFEHSAGGPWNGKYAEIVTGRLDMAACIMRTPERERQLVFTSPYTSAPIVVYARNDAPMLASLSQLEGKTLAVVKGYTTEELFRRNHPGIRLVPVGSVREGLDRLERGECSAFADALVAGNYYLAQAGYTDLRVAGGTPYNYGMCMAARDPVLASILEKALRAIPAGDRDAMARKWFAVRVERITNYSLIWKILLAAAAAVTLFVYRNRLLRREIGRRLLIEAELVRSKEKTEEANKELEAFSYSVSHDLRAPLRHVSGFVQLLQAHAKSLDDAKINRYTGIIAEAARKMGQLIDDLLSFSRAGRAQMRLEPVSLAALVAECRHDLEHDLQGRAVEWEVGELPEVMADRALLRQVFANLLGNAVKYTRPRAPARIGVSARREGGETVVTVRDNGVGFDMQYSDKLFGVFQRLHGEAEFEGTGIGLANVRRIVSRHGGRTWAEGEVDKGSAFHFSLPEKAAVAAEGRT